MPTYGYICDDCGQELEAFQKMSDAPLRTCPACGKDALRRQIFASGIVFKGSGFYKTDYASKKDGSSSEGSRSDTSTSESGKSDAGKSDSGKSDSAKSESGKSDSAKSESGKSDSAKSGSGGGDKASPASD
jgi:putative FmdB family regulatory protein